MHSTPAKTTPHSISPGIVPVPHTVPGRSCKGHVFSRGYVDGFVGRHDRFIKKIKVILRFVSFPKFSYNYVIVMS
ncbi:hypothetical protein RIR_jg35570.t1 [Rhizophagus irregularis DAOM 181602=DAOM 197198]|nr:hypothetical protein RIR_jg35570.t1 [Rhizophagus irregularis DAOM 181602=DAOM 197198]